MCNILPRESLLSSLLGNEYSQEKSLDLSYEIQKALESTFEGDKHARKVRLQNLICLFQKAKMMEDESVTSYFGRISEIVAEIKASDGKKDEDEIAWKILKNLTPTYKKTTQMIE